MKRILTGFFVFLSVIAFATYYPATMIKDPLTNNAAGITNGGEIKVNIASSPVTLKTTLFDSSGQSLQTVYTSDQIGTSSRGLLFYGVENLSATPTAMPALIDKYTGGLVVLDVSHYKTHAGKKFHWGEYRTVSNGITYSYYFRTGSLNFPHIVCSHQCTAVMDFSLLEAPSVSASGTQQTTYNMARSSSNISVMQLFYGPVFTGGTSLFAWRTTANQYYGLERDESEMILDQNTSYIFQFTAQANGNLSIQFDWYE